MVAASDYYKDLTDETKVLGRRWRLAIGTANSTRCMKEDRERYSTTWAENCDRLRSQYLVQRPT